MGSIHRGVRIAAALAVLVASGAARAQDGCFADVQIPAWVAGDLIALPVPGASRPLPIDRFDLCSASPGFGPLSDGYRYLVRRYDGDAVFTTLLESIDNRGLGGLVLRTNERTPDAAYVRVTAHLRTDGTALLRSAVRLAGGDPSDEMGSIPVVVELPVFVRIARSGTQVVTSFAEPGDPFADHLVVDTGGSELDANPLVYGMVQASEDFHDSAHAIFGEVAIDVPDDPPLDPSTCVDGFVTPTTGGTDPIILRGDFLDRATGASIAGVPARIVAKTRGTLVVQPAAGSLSAGERSGGSGRPAQVHVVQFRRADPAAPAIGAAALGVRHRAARRWQHYVLCTDSAPGEHSCGNPWGPSNECHNLSCDQCHKQVGAVSNEFSGLDEIATAWLPTFATDSVSECLEEIEASGGATYAWFTPVECQ